MKDPERLLDGEGSTYERELLGALARERPSRALSRRMRQGLVLGGVLASAKTGMAGFIALAGLVTVGAGVGVFVLSHRTTVPASALVASAASPTHAEAPLVATSAVDAPAVVPATADDAQPPDALGAPLAPSAPGRANDLREEIALMDRARAAVRAGDGQGALALLTAYERKFPRGEFRQEQTVLRGQALSASGDRAAARALGKRFLAAHPESPHAERIEQLLGAD